MSVHVTGAGATAPLSEPWSRDGPGPSSPGAANVRSSVDAPEKQFAASGVADGFAPAPAAKTSGAFSSLPTPSVLGQPQPSSEAARSTGAEPPSSTASVPTFSTSAKSSATQRKVAKLLGIATSSEIKDMATYVDSILPGYFYCLGDHDKDESSSAEVTTTTSHTSTPASSGAASSHSHNSKTTSTALRNALDARAIDVHKSFLQEFGAVYQSYLRVAVQINELESKCSSLEDTLNTAAGRPSREVENFFYQIQAYQTELQLVQTQNKEVEEFRKQHHFGTAEQKVLEEGEVDMNFLNVLERARQVNQRSSELMQLQECHQSALAVMEATYEAITRATEKIARHLLSTAGSSEGRSAGGATSAAARGVGSIAADVPEVTGFQLRCVRLLYEESPSLHEKFLDEVARLRRASVLRRYFHLLTTGSANTSSGLYQSGGQPSAHDGGVDSKHASNEAGMGTRPLEAELNNPTYFFSSLCAWLHQTIVEEQDFIHHFFVHNESEAGQGRQRRHATTAAPSSCPPAAGDATRTADDKARQQVLLDNVFGGVCKHIRAALSNVLERQGRSAAALGSATGASEGEGRAGWRGGVALSDSADALAPRKGPRGLTGGLTRLFMAATGRSAVAALRSAGQDELNALLQRYTGVTTRAQQEAVATTMLRPLLQGIQTCVALVQMFEYYTVTTFVPLLGEASALTRLIHKTAPEQTRELFQRLLHVLDVHLLDSTVGIIGRTSTLRRLASSNALKQVAEGDDTQNTSLPAVEHSTLTNASSSAFVLDFLVAFTYGNDANSMRGAPKASKSALLSENESDISIFPSSLSAAATTTRFSQVNDGQLLPHSAHDLQRVLAQLILPPSPEVAAYCAVVHAVLRDTAHQVELLASIAEQQRAAGVQGRLSSGQPESSDLRTAAVSTHTEVTYLVQAMLQSLLKAAHSVEADGPFRANLDDPCRAIIEYNVLHELRDVLEEHAAVLGVLFKGSDAQYQEAGQCFDSIRKECTTTMTTLRQRLVSAWVTAVKFFYFPISTEAVVAAVSSAAAEETHEKGFMTAKRDVRRVLKQFIHVYNTIASLGHLPEPVPLLSALAGGSDVGEEVRRKVTLSIVEDAYPAEFQMLSSLPPTEEVVAVQTEMAPENLLKLVDLRSPTPAATA